MTIDRIHLHSFRNYEEAVFCPSDAVNLIYGNNGSGKTNILEAIRYCALGRSHRTGYDREVIRKNERVGVCSLSVRSNHGMNQIKITLTPFGIKKKNVEINGKCISRMSDLMGKLRCVMFSPEDILIIKEGPSLRRRYLDMFISQINTAYFIELQKYNRLINQRNALLKQIRKNEKEQTILLEIMEEQIVQSQAVLIPIRMRYIEKIRENVRFLYQKISQKSNEILDIQYCGPLNQYERVSDDLRKKYESSREHDIINGVTSVGIHRDDIEINLNNHLIRTYGSQGQIRTAALCMKMSQISIMESEVGEKPVLLLDDVLSELDYLRRKFLLESISGVQTFITCTDLEDYDKKVAFHPVLVKNQDGIAKIENSIELDNKTVEDPLFL